MIEFLGFDDNKKIGLGLLAFATLLYFLAILLFFARSLLLLSNLIFLLGLYFFVGITGILKFFTKKGTYLPSLGKIKGSIVFFVGLVLIALNFGLFGAIAQIAGFILIFRTFLPDLYDYICKAPIVGHYLKSYMLQNFLDKLAGNQHNRI